MPFILCLCFFVLAAIGCFGTTWRTRNIEWLFGGIAATVIALLIVIFSSFTTVGTGQIAYAKLFGAMQPVVYTEGFNWVNPLYSITEFSIQRETLEFTDRKDSSSTNNFVLEPATGYSSNKVQLKLAMTVGYQFFPTYVPDLVQRYGKDLNLVTPSVRSAIRNCIAQRTWEDSVSGEGRDALSRCIQESSTREVISDLQRHGFSEEQATEIVAIDIPKLQSVEPANERIANAIAEQQAAEIELSKQTALTNVAAQVALRQEQEGLGIQKMMDALPTNRSVEEMVAVLNAVARKTEADAFNDAVVKGNSNFTMIVGGGNTPNVSVPSIATTSASTSVPIDTTVPAN